MQKQPFALALAVVLVVGAPPADATIPLVPTPLLPPAQFDGAPLSAARLNAWLTIAHRATLLSWGPCNDVTAAGVTLGTIDHCVAFTVGTARHAYSYLLTDRRCPTATPTAACYGGFLIGALTETRTSYSAWHGLEVESSATVRIGVRRTILPAPGSGAAPTVRYELPTTPVVAIEQQFQSGGASSMLHTIVRDGAGAILSDEITTRMAGSLTSTFSCDDAGELYGNATRVAWNLAATSAALGIAAGGTLAGIAIAGGGTVVTLGGLSAPAGATGIAVAGLSYMLAPVVFMAFHELGEALASFGDAAVREACELAVEAQSFEPEDDVLMQQYQPQTSGGSSSQGGGGSDSCSGSEESTITVDGVDYEGTCTKMRDSDGNCVIGCAYYTGE